MNTNINPLMIPIREFVGTRQSNLFQTLKLPQFTGKLILQSAKGEEWVFFLYLGRILYATGGINDIRRWKRNLTLYAPQLINQLPYLPETIDLQKDIKNCWQYDLLYFWLNKQEVKREQIVKIIRSIIVEILFDLTQTMEITFQLAVTSPLETQLTLIDPDQAITEAWRQWQDWQRAKLADRTPNNAPIIRQREELKQRTSPKSYEIMNKLFNGQNSLRDLAVQLRQDIVPMTKLMIPYIQLGLIDLVEPEDLSSPLIKTKDSKNKLPRRKPKKVIACIENDFTVTEIMKTIVLSANYKFMSFNHPALAIASMRRDKPNFIFLDLDINNSDGYEVCNQLHKSSAFQHIPIVMMSENIEKIDQVKAKMSGCSDFIEKPLESEKVLNIISKFLTN